jgi:hypothetical protein
MIRNVLRFILVFALVLVAGLCLALAAPPVIKEYALDERVVYRIPLPHEHGVTTFLFPNGIQALGGANITTQPNQPGDFLLAYTPDQSFFNLRALRENARGVLNVVFDGKAYIIQLEASAQPLHSVTFFSSTQDEPGKSQLTPARLLDLLDKAKAYALLRVHHPDVVAHVAYATPNRVAHYLGFTATVAEVWRFEPEDVLVYHVRLANQTAEPVRYNPRHLAVRVGDRIYYQAIADASGVIPPNATTAVYFAVCGSSTGGRNNLAVDNDWNVLVPRLTPAPLDFAYVLEPQAAIRDETPEATAPVDAARAKHDAPTESK